MGIENICINVNTNVTYFGDSGGGVGNSVYDGKGDGCGGGGGGGIGGGDCGGGDSGGGIGGGGV